MTKSALCVLLISISSFCSLNAPLLAATPRDKVTYSPPNVSTLNSAQLRKYYAWREKMDWLLAPIHTRSDLGEYLSVTASSRSPLSALSPDAKKRFLSSLVFHKHGLAGFGSADLKYLSTTQVYRILALFGTQVYTMDVTGGKFRKGGNPTGSNSHQPSLIEQKFDKYYIESLRNVNLPIDKRMQIIKGEYKKLFSSVQHARQLSQTKGTDLRLLLRASQNAASITLDPTYAQDALHDFLELEKRDLARNVDYHNAYRALIETRQFEAARKFYRRHSKAVLEPVPMYTDDVTSSEKNGPTILVVNTTKRELTRHRINLDKPAQIVILSDPGCHFSRNFYEAVQTHPKLRSIFERYGLWVTPPNGVIEFDTLQRWNKAHPKMRLNIMYSFRGWPMVKHLAIPRFWFLKNGKVVTKRVGWPRGGNFAELESGLKAIGLWHTETSG